MENAADYLVDAQWLGAHRDDPTVVLIDTRTAVEYRAGHLRGARHFDPFPFHYYDTTDRGIAEFKAQLEWIFSALGITGEETVVFYETDSGMRASRGMWALEYAGHGAARMLDGGLRGAASEELVEKIEPVIPSGFKVRPHEDAIASAAYIVAHLGQSDVQIFDVRSDQEYYGERIRAKYGGAIPGAIHQDWTHSVMPDGAFKSATALREEFEKLGLRADAEIITYCQGGYRAANAYVALKMAGFTRVRNYLASWAEWGNRDDLPIEHPKRHS